VAAPAVAAPAVTDRIGANFGKSLRPLRSNVPKSALDPADQVAEVRL
jgi:hypothetical protein